MLSEDRQFKHAQAFFRTVKVAWTRPRSLKLCVRDLCPQGLITVKLCKDFLEDYTVNYTEHNHNYTNYMLDGICCQRNLFYASHSQVHAALNRLY